MQKGRMIGLHYIVSELLRYAGRSQPCVKDLASVIKPVPQHGMTIIAKPSRYSPAPTRANHGKRKRQWR
jgi:hypothetical protein